MMNRSSSIPESAPDWNGAGEILLVDKPIDWTSFDVVKKIRSLFGIRKLGHAGTLDPLATGLLILCSGQKTKDIGEFALLDKVYEGTLELGIISPSHDGETQPQAKADPGSVTREVLESAVLSFCGTISQVPPMYSAVKYGGRPLYKYARAGKTVERSAKEISVYDFEITRFENPMADFRIRCSKGTYIRSLARDLGEMLGCGAILRSLRRVAIGSYRVEQAFTIADLIALRDRMRRDTTSHASRPTAV